MSAQFARSDPLSIVSVVGVRVIVPELLLAIISGKLNANPVVVCTGNVNVEVEVPEQKTAVALSRTFKVCVAQVDSPLLFTGTPAREKTSCVAAPAEGTSIQVCGTPFGTTGAATPPMELEVPAAV